MEACPLTAEQLQECQQAWVEQRRSHANSGPSQLQKLMYAAIQQLPVAWLQQPQLEQVSYDRLLLIDISGSWQMDAG